MNLKRFAALPLSLALCLMFGVALAQENDLPDVDPPDRAARLSFLQGDVSLQPAGEQEWAAAIVNRPLTTGDKLWTDQGARAEIYVGQAAVRLDSNTGFSFLNVDDDTIQMRITSGVINVSVRTLTNEQIEIDTPNMALSILRPGNYRVEVNDAGDTSIVKVSEGEAEASGGSQNVIVHAQQVVTFSGDQLLTAQFGTLGAPDDFDSWSLERDRRDELAATSRTAEYVSPDVTGYEDLEDNGSWSSEPEYGYVWTPRAVAVGWTPYSYGRWSWVGPWGWTWIDDAPWGYAPFHYGRWAHVRNRWCWVPGPRHVRAVYAPALVGWVGGGRAAWFPLAPREVYVPGRRFSNRYVERVNASNTVNVSRSLIRKVYENQGANVTYRNRVPGGVTEVSRSAFTSAQRVDGHRIRVDEREIARTPVTALAPRIEPVRESRMGGNDARRYVRVPPQAVVARQVVVKRAPPASAEHFVRPARQVNVEREPASRPTNNRDVRNVPSAQTWRDDRPREVTQRSERPSTARPPQSEQGPPTDRQAEVRRQLREAMERQQQPQQPQPSRQVEPQQYQQREQQQRQREAQQQSEQYQQREQSQQREQQQQRQREAQQQREQYQQREQSQQHEQQQQRQREAQQQQERAPRPSREVEQRQRPEPSKPAEDKPRPQRNPDGDRNNSSRTNRR